MMPRKNYRVLEDHIISIMSVNSTFRINGEVYQVTSSCKPSSSKGECKTDVYISAKNMVSNQNIELKLSIKSKDLNEFQENKVNAERAEAYFGENWKQIIAMATLSIKHEFENRVLLFGSGKHPTKPNSITVGWKLEIASKPRALSVKAPLSVQEVRDYVYKGTNQTPDKKNAFVNGYIVPNSGVADFLVITSTDDIKCSQDVINKMVLIDNYVPHDTYLIFTANNYRTDVKKADGPRALAVYVNWECKHNKLIPTFVYNQPLVYTGEGDIAPIACNALRKLGKVNVSDINPRTDLINPNIFLV